MPDSQKYRLSVAVIAKDEADRIPICLGSLDFADDVVVVVDSASQDDTLAIAQSYGYRVLSRPWMGYARQKQFAVDNCANDWVMILDADECIPGQTAKAIVGLLADPPVDIAAYGFMRRNIFHGRWFKRCGWWPDRVVRLVDRSRGKFSENLVHEQWVADGGVRQLDVVIEHYSFRNYAGLIEKMQNYSTLAAQQMKNDGRRARWWTSISHGLWTFLRSYFLELGILEGFDGFMISTTNAGGSYLKYAKLWELWRHGKARQVEKVDCKATDAS
ncbi:glycosyl transferase, family II [Desulfosarcina variabilis str. Montpellier]|uniref:glycosyltransferase family 2 protein n=1 Tax=Desulfosarcina variabilis TaxID=2300 RepID=UPI003AFB8165